VIFGLFPAHGGALLASADESSAPDAARKRLAAVVRSYHSTVWRDARRLGVAAEAVDDVVQEVFVIAAKKLADVTNERAFLFAITLRVAANHRNRAHVRREVSDSELGERQPDSSPSADLLLDQKRLRLLLDEVLDELPVGLRVVFVLSELDELSLQQIAEMTEAPIGTVATRLRRARELFRIASKRIRARHRLDGGETP